MMAPVSEARMPCQKMSRSTRNKMKCVIAKTVKTPGLRRTIHSLRHGCARRVTQARESSRLG